MAQVNLTTLFVILTKPSRFYPIRLRYMLRYTLSTLYATCIYNTTYTLLRPEGCAKVPGGCPL